MGKEVKVTWLSQEECIEAGAMDMAQILEQVKNVNLWLSSGDIVETDLLHLLWDEGSYAGRRIGVHAALIRSKEISVAAVKGIPSNPDNPVKLGMPRSNGLIILYDEETGFPYAVMDDTLVSALRTGASSALGAQYCANPDAEILGLIGCGPIQDAHIEATSLVMDHIETVRLYDIVEEKAELFANRWRHLGYEFEICHDAECAIAESDIVYTCTNVNFGEEYVQKAWIKRGSFHSAASVWDYTDTAILEGCNRYCMDYKGRLKDEKYPFTELTQAGKLEADDIIQLGEVISGSARCRKSRDDSVFFVTLGLCANDTANSFRIYQNAKKLGLGTEVYLWKNPRLM